MMQEKFPRWLLRQKETHKGFGGNSDGSRGYGHRFAWGANNACVPVEVISHLCFHHHAQYFPDAALTSYHPSCRAHNPVCPSSVCPSWHCRPLLRYHPTWFCSADPICRAQAPHFRFSTPFHSLKKLPGHKESDFKAALSWFFFKVFATVCLSFKVAFAFSQRKFAYQKNNPLIGEFKLSTGIKKEIFCMSSRHFSTSFN